MISKPLKISFLLIILLSTLSFSIHGQSRYTVFLKSGEQIEASRLSFRSQSILGGANLKIKDPVKQRFEANEVDSVHISEGFDLVVKVPVKHISQVHWAEVILDKNGVKAYEISITHTNMTTVGPNATPMYGGSTQKKIQYYTIDENVTKRVKRSNLKEDLQGYPTALELLKKNKGVTVAKVLMYGLGGVLILSGILNNANNDGGLPPPEKSGPPPRVFLGVGLIAGATLLNFIKSDDPIKALEEFAKIR
jgi:hypothetical protein